VQFLAQFSFAKALLSREVSIVKRSILACSLLVLLSAGAVSADVSMVERSGINRSHNGKTKREHAPRHHHQPATAGQSATANGGKLQFVTAAATGSQTLIDASGLEYFINTDITFTTSSSASGAMSEASYTAAVAATTSAGGTTASTLNDAFDGYNALCASLTGATGPCATGNASYTIYNQNGPATTECNGRQIVLPAQTIGNFQVSRKVFVPTNDTFARWLNIVTNTSGSPQTITLVTSNNLGSDSNTRIVSSSSGNAAAEVTDTWVSTFQNYSGNTSSDPRLGHVLQGAGAATPVANISFADGDDNPFWAYNLTVPAGATQIIANFVTGQPSKAAANTKAAELAGLPDNAVQCLTANERAEIVNFAPAVAAVPAASGTGLALLALGLAACAVMVLRRMAGA
jgi:hypothetical protein